MLQGTLSARLSKEARGCSTGRSRSNNIEYHKVSAACQISPKDQNQGSQRRSWAKVIALGSSLYHFTWFCGRSNSGYWFGNPFPFISTSTIGALHGQQSAAHCLSSKCGRDFPQNSLVFALTFFSPRCFLLPPLWLRRRVRQCSIIHVTRVRGQFRLRVHERWSSPCCGSQRSSLPLHQVVSHVCCEVCSSLCFGDGCLLSSYQSLNEALSWHVWHLTEVSPCPSVTPLAIHQGIHDAPASMVLLSVIPGRSGRSAA